MGSVSDVQPRRDLSRYVRWPKYIRIQRARKILYQRLKVPPAINQFSNTLDKNLALNLFKLLHKYRPEDKRPEGAAHQGKGGEEGGGRRRASSKKPLYVKYGINHITKLCEDKKAQLVVIAHDVDPIELVIWLPAVCRKLDIPYCIVKSKSRLGRPRPQEDGDGARAHVGATRRTATTSAARHGHPPAVQRERQADREDVGRRHHGLQVAGGDGEARARDRRRRRRRR